MTPGGATTTTAYTLDGQPSLVTDPRGSTTVYRYDPAGRLQSVTAGTTPVEGLPAVSQTISYTYDLNSRLVGVSDGAGHTSTRRYDAFNRLVAETDPLSTTTSYAYDALDRVTRQTVGANVPAEARTTDYRYDAGGRLLSSIVDPAGLRLTTTYGYSLPGSADTWSVQRVEDPNGHATRYQYNSLGLQSSVTDALTNTWSFSYDNLGRLVAQSDPLGHAVTMGVDALGRTTVLTQDGRTERWQYRADGLLAQSTDFAGRSTSYQYDPDGQLTAVDYPAGTADVGYRYNRAGQVITMTDGLGETSYRYDALGRLSARTRGGRTVGYRYNAAGQTERLDYWGTGAVEYGYDAAGRVSSLTPWGGAATSYTYRSTGQLASVRRASGVATDYGYDTAGRLTRLLHHQGVSPLLDIQYTLDAAGNRRAQRDSDGETSYGYDALDRLDQVVYPAIPGGPAAETVGYGLDAVGNRLSDGTSSYRYDASDRITSPGFQYDANGNLLSDGASTYRYDAANRLVQSVTGTITTTYGYDGWGNLVRETVRSSAGVTTTDLLLDEQAPLPQLLAELRSDGAELRYAYGPEGLSAQRQSGQGVATPLLDGQGSLRALTDASGAVILRRSYDAFGRVRFQTGGAWSTLGYTGERAGSADGTLYLRARHYLPRLGRFLQRDSFAGFPERPQSLNRFAYAENNPVNHTDPSGRAVDASGHWTPCNMLPGRSDSCSLGELGGFWNSDDGEKTRRVGQRLGQHLLNLPQAMIDGLFDTVTDPVQALRDAVNAPFEVLRDLALGSLCGDPDMIADGIFGYAMLVAGGQEGWNAGVDHMPFHRRLPSPRIESKTSFSVGPRGEELASPELLDAVTRNGRREIFQDSETQRLLDYFRANASASADGKSISLRSDPRKIEVLEEFLHGTQVRLGIQDRMSTSQSEIHVKSFMIRHKKILGISEADVEWLTKSMDMYR
jgi:RHS repeat-associated protein